MMSKKTANPPMTATEIRLRQIKWELGLGPKQLTIERTGQLLIELAEILCDLGLDLTMEKENGKHY